MHSVLLVDDDPLILETLEDILEDSKVGHRAVSNAKDALQLAREEEFDVVLTDIQMPGMDGLELLGELRELRPATPVIVMTGHASIDSAVRAMRGGAFDYVTKPFAPDALVASLNKALEHRELERENRRLRRAVDSTSAFGELIGVSPALREIFATIRKISGSSSTVLITGESGTGKDVVARTIHFTGARAKGPYVPINCTAMPEGLLESELFGHVKGAFTGAHANKRGLFQEAEGGTLFLDEIGDMSLALQAKLLRVLQDREVRPVGGTRAERIDVRVIAATHRDLSEEIDEGRFRKDLFFRLNVLPIAIPPLRERPEDVAALAQRFLEKHAPGDGIPSLSAAALEALKRRRWEGNARELENAIERALAFSSGGELRLSDFRFEDESESRDEGDDRFLDEALQRRLTLKELNERYTRRVLEEVGGSKSKAAEVLGVNRRTLYRWEDDSGD